MSNSNWNKQVVGEIEFGKSYTHHNKIPNIKRIEFWNWKSADDFPEVSFISGKEVVILPAILQSINMIPSSIYGNGLVELPMLTYLHPLKIKSIPDKTFGFLDSFQPIGLTNQRRSHLFLLEEVTSYKIVPIKTD